MDTLPVLVISRTNVEGDLVVGVRIRVEALVEGGVTVALEVEAKDHESDGRGSDIEFKGAITALSDASIDVDGFGPILITDDTMVRGNAFLGAEVKVRAVLSEGLVHKTSPHPYPHPPGEQVNRTSD